MSHDFSWPGSRKKQLTYDQQIKETTLHSLGNPEASGSLSEGEEDKTILRGHFSWNHFSTAIDLHSSDTVEVENHEVEAVLPPALTVCVLLEGKLECAFGDFETVLDATEGPKAYIWAYGRPIQWRRKIQAGMRIRKVNISIEADWLRRQINKGMFVDQEIDCLFQNPFDIHQWTPSSKITTLTSQVILQGQSDTLLHSIRRESKSLEILGEAFEHFAKSEQEVIPDGKQRTLSRAELVRDFIERQDMTQLNLAHISKELGFSVSSMQSSFKQAYEMTIMDYVRERCLIKAYEALDKDQVSIAEAAFIAGYNSPANFSTAFKRHFGVSPSEIH
ncbi:MAG: AraC family transcriptional regulator [Sneathiellales bacterium]|nr:AraC family transcriptional regulator [Sneathiellales bacterium]